MKKITFRPYKVHLVFGAFSLLLCLMSLIFLAFSPTIDCLLLALALTLGTGALAFFLFKTYKTVVVFDAAGIRISESNTTGGDHFWRWEDFSCACWTTNYKGHRFLVLIKGEYSSNKVREAMRWSSMTSKVIIDDFIVICLDITQNTEQIESIVKSSVRLSKTVRGPFS